MTLVQKQMTMVNIQNIAVVLNSDTNWVL